jgi:hypothetical protein
MVVANNKIDETKNAGKSTTISMAMGMQQTKLPIGSKLPIDSAPQKIHKTIPAFCNTPRQTQNNRNYVLWAELWFVVVCWCVKAVNLLAFPGVRRSAEDGFTSVRIFFLS